MNLWKEPARPEALGAGFSGLIDACDPLGQDRWLPHELVASIGRELRAPLAEAEAGSRAIGALLDAGATECGALRDGIGAVMASAMQANAIISRVRAMVVKRDPETAMGEVVTAIAHELRQPIGAIVANCEASLRWLVRAEPNVAKIAQLSARSAEAAVRAGEIIDAIEQVSASGQPAREAVDLPGIVDDALRLLHESGEARAELVAHVEGAPGPLLGDRQLLQQVIVNLVVNALQAGAGRIAVRIAPARDGVMLEVRDNGPGFAPESLSHVFGGFFTTKAAGFGIGLTLCRSIVRAHGGTIAAGNHPEGGALVRILLPVAGQPYTFA